MDKNHYLNQLSRLEEEMQQALRLHCARVAKDRERQIEKLKADFLAELEDNKD